MMRLKAKVLAEFLEIASFSSPKSRSPLARA
jgi:hypothetical protein